MLVPPLPDEEYHQLKNSIKSNGLWSPILLNQDFVVIDGHNRLRACQELGVKPRYEIRKFADKLAEKMTVIECNLRRRHLTDFQKGELGVRLEPLYTELAGRRMKAGKTPSSNELGVLGQARDNVARKVGLSPTTYQRVKTIIESGNDFVLDRVASNRLSIAEGYNKIRRREKRQLFIDTQKVKLPGSVRLYNRSFIDSPVDDGTVDLVFVDPPYSKEYLNIYKDLGQFAMRVLRDGGSLVTYLGQLYLPQILDALLDSGLTYWWIFCVKHDGAKASVYSRQVFVEWKPLLWFVKGKKPHCAEFLNDYINSGPQPKKVLHEWEQSMVEAEHCIKGLTYERAVVCDPCMGAGTTGVAAMKLGRQFIGFEVDRDHFKVARGQIGRRPI